MQDDTVELLKARIEQWEQTSRQIGEWHGSDMWNTAIKGMLGHLSGTDGLLERPVPTTRRILPRAFLVEWAGLIAKSCWRISEKWRREYKQQTTLVPTASRIIEAQRAGHNVGVGRLLTIWHMPAMLRMTCAIAGGSLVLWQALHRRQAA